MAEKKPKIPPQNIEAEASVLGALMLDSKSIFQVADLLTPNDFYSPSNALVYASILRLYERHQPIDLLSVKTELTESGNLEKVGGTSVITELIESVPTAAHIEHYAKIVKNKRVLRDLVHASAEIHERAFGDSEVDGVEDILDAVEKKIFAISQASSSQRFVEISSELAGAYERIERLHQGEKVIAGVSSGFPALDNLLSGFHRSDLIVLGARPSLGKTSLALDIARHIATKEKKVVAIFSLEMSKDQIIDRLISAEAGVPLWNLRTGRLKDELDFQLVQAALDSLSQTRLFVDDAPSPTVLQMRSMARRLQLEHGLDFVVVDYLQLVQSRVRSDNPVQQITEISRGLKALARELEVPVLALSQLSRGVEQRERQRPRLSDLRDSGSIEQDADVVMFIYRKDKARPDLTLEEQNTAEIIVEKHRNGPTGVATLKFDQERVSFRSIDRAHPGIEVASSDPGLGAF
jgi:replicative DNA helicase